MNKMCEKLRNNKNKMKNNSLVNQASKQAITKKKKPAFSYKVKLSQAELVNAAATLDKPPLSRQQQLKL